MRLLLAILVGKIIAQLIRFLKIGGGSAAPGLYALKIDPDLVEKLASRIPKHVIITGTNGKTTTSRILAHFAKMSGLKIIRNHTGSNLERGIASTLISSFQLPVSNFQLGIWELDEAAFNTVAPKLKPDIVVFLNVFRDQLDRYGEVDSVVKRWCNTLKMLNLQATVLVNGDDANCAKLTKCFKGKTLKFGVRDYKIVGESIQHQKEQENFDFEAKNVKLNGLKGSFFHLQSPSFLASRSEHLPVALPLPGIYHIYDALAAIACATQLFPDTLIHRYTDTLKNFKPAFGRVERLEFGSIFLIKNPAGATQVFETIAPNLKPNDRLLMALNDNLADGTDVSWIWDANFEVLLRHKKSSKSAGVKVKTPQGCTLIASGNRAYDLANRLKYAGFNPELINVQKDLSKALQEARDGLNGHLFILPTYTAMLELQGILTKSGIKKNYWEEV
ncbi:MAG: MurT ligase domain-containing protein [Candidatus Daviesbacteria bacterium]|nr:MurT ligase domain-containing protein [Candidatus Daviesbacteria bacterium]